ncbi:MAG: biotin/lipoyl-binding protein [Holophagales bacterium]|jgi:glutaconyl-CoA decarboxylase|nr:biotin/lipoyl-binding protein [Holophagales bacterium]
MSEHVMNIGGKEYRAEVKELTSERAKVVVNSVEYDVNLVSIGRKEITISDTALRPPPPPPVPTGIPTPALYRPAPMVAGQSSIVAPMPGAIFQIRVKEGDNVQAGQVLLVMEAMKMENPVTAPFNGTVSKIHVREGDNVGEGDLLVEVARPKMAML